MNIERKENMKIRVINNDASYIESQSVEANLLFSILEKLEEIRCGLIDIENAADKTL